MRLAEGIALLALPVLLVALALWVSLGARPGRRAFIAEHPEQRPFGWKLLLRGLPYIVLGLAIAAFAAANGNWLIAVLAVAGTVLLSVEVWNRRRPPGAID